MLYFLLLPAVLSYDSKAIEGDDSCNPACINKGICQNGICFCEQPYSGVYCEDELDLETRVSPLTLIVMILGGFVIGYISVFLCKFCMNVFEKEPEEGEEDGDVWKR
jgi:hypothetical protein